MSPQHPRAAPRHARILLLLLVCAQQQACGADTTLRHALQFDNAGRVDFSPGYFSAAPPHGAHVTAQVTPAC
jgi:hypothetical protein